MVGIPIRVPFLIVMLIASMWVFFLVKWKPELLEQTPTNRTYISFLEGLLCSLLWGLALSQLSTDPLESIVLSAILTGAIWMGVVLYSRHRYSQTLNLYPPRPKSNPAKRSYL